MLNMKLLLVVSYVQSEGEDFKGRRPNGTIRHQLKDTIWDWTNLIPNFSKYSSNVKSELQALDEKKS